MFVYIPTSEKGPSFFFGRWQTIHGGVRSDGDSWVQVESGGKAYMSTDNMFAMNNLDHD